jgi:hypothetical protein
MIQESEYKSISEWRKYNEKDYRTAVRRGMIDDMCEFFGWDKRKPNGYWTKERCLEEARKYKTVSEWRNCGNGSPDAARDNGWLEECKAHMKHGKGHKPNGYWTKEKVIEISQKYKTKKDWRNNHKASFRAAQRYGWYKEATEHMVNLSKPKDYWTKERCLEEALKYDKKSDWCKSSSYSYRLSIKMNWFEEHTKHMR